MLMPLATAIAVFAFLSLPGWILAADRKRPIWSYAAAGFASQFLVVLLGALIALMVPGGMDVRWTMAVTLVLAVAAWLLRGSASLAWPERIEPWSIVVPALITIAAAALTRGAIDQRPDGLIVHAWFNADGFKHLGHVNGIANYGLPAQDIFAGGGPLAYYWFFHTIPAIGAKLHGDTPGALIASGLVQTFAFWLLVYGLLRTAGTSAGWTALFALLCWLSPSPAGFAALLARHGDIWAVATEMDITTMYARLLSGSLPFRLSLYTPHHQWMLAGLLSWGLIQAQTERDAKALHLLALAPLVSAGAVSTLFGLGCLCAYAIMRLLDDRIPLARRAGEIAAMGLLALSVPLIFHIVGPGAGQSGLASPIFEFPAYVLPAWQRLLLAAIALPLLYGVSLIGLAGIGRGWKRQIAAGAQLQMLRFATTLVASGLVTLIGVSLIDNPRLVMEFQLRDALLPYLGMTIGLAWLLDETDGKQRFPRQWATAATPFLALGLATPVLDSIWLVHSTESWQVRIPADDLSVLSYLRNDTPTDAIVLQYPALPFVKHGVDTWAAILGNRSVYASPRATHFQSETQRMEQATRYFSGKGPLPRGQYDYIYLSRTLEPQSYDLLNRRLTAAGGWRAVRCGRNACLWKREGLAA
ncbi:hypothetical protein [Flavisphingomonas formosensis]|uniref:hypothetical protein n=1 Tax=Flavisphingomonas formosensis TaxID=861534 RepID=UPI0012F9630E|nr:hypothetical protein [Sphingomonas formosensis]